MACPAIYSGESFLATALAHVDCQARTIGAYGFGALADPASGVSIALASLLTVFVALFGVRLLLGYPMEGRDVVADMLKVGIVLALATSWPAWRVLGYDLVINGPSEIARSIGLAAQLPGSSGDLAGRLQRIDGGLASLNLFGSGRLGIAQGDWFQLGFSRIAFLTGTLGSLALVRLTTGILLSIAPLMAGLLLFGVSRSIFAGWVKALAMAFLASLSVSIVLAAELALIEPWLLDALQRRQAEQQVLDAPVEILVVTLAFSLVLLGVIMIAAWIAFHPNSWMAHFIPAQAKTPLGQAHHSSDRIVSVEGTSQSHHARSIAHSVSETIRRDERLGVNNQGLGGMTSEPAASQVSGSYSPIDPADSLGASYRRTNRRVSASSQRRDQGA